MSNNNPQYEIKKALEYLKDISSQHEGCNIMALAAIPESDAGEANEEHQIHILYNGIPEVIESMIVAAAGLDEEFKTILLKAVATIKKQDK